MLNLSDSLSIAVKKNVAFLLFWTCVLLVNAQDNQVPPPPPPPSGELNGETMPEYPGGEEAMYQDIMDNLVMPDIKKSKRAKGRVYVDFLVQKDGTVADVSLRKGIIDRPEYGEAAVEAVKKLKPFKPATVNGVPVQIRITVPLAFN